jgi:myosin heavy subunit
MLAYKVPATEYAIGISRLFLKSAQRKALEDMRDSGPLASPDELKAIVSGIIRKRWARAIHAVSLCLYMPKLAKQLRVRRALGALYRASLLGAFLNKRLKAARKRIELRRMFARRRLRGCFNAVRVSVRFWLQIKANRRQRLFKAVSLARLVVPFAARWAALGRQKIVERAEASKRVEESLKEVAEQRRQIQEERRQDNERRRREEEERQQIEANFGAELLRRRQAEELARKQREEEDEQRRDAEAQRMAERAEERAAMAKEHQRQNEEMEKMRAEIARMTQMRASLRPGENKEAEVHTEASTDPDTGTELVSSNGDDEEITPQDSVSVAFAPRLNLELEAQAAEQRNKIKDLERKLAEKNAEKELQEDPPMVARIARMSTASAASRKERYDIGGNRRLSTASIADPIADKRMRRASLVALRADAGLHTGEGGDTITKAKRHHMAMSRQFLIDELYGGSLLGPDEVMGNAKLKPVRKSEARNLKAQFDSMNTVEAEDAAAKVPSPCRDRKSGASESSQSRKKSIRLIPFRVSTAQPPTEGC